MYILLILSTSLTSMPVPCSLRAHSLATIRSISLVRLCNRGGTHSRWSAHKPLAYPCLTSCKLYFPIHSVTWLHNLVCHMVSWLQSNSAVHHALPLDN